MASSGADHAVARNPLRSAEDINNSIPAPCLSILRDICLHNYFFGAARPKTEASIGSDLEHVLGRVRCGEVFDLSRKSILRISG